jgi:branched-chain amino acid transport system substrate-binding protein
MKKWRFLSVTALMTGLLLLCAGCNKSAEETAADDQLIKVGEFASLTGKEAAFGQSSHRGTQLAVDDLNASGGVLGKKIKLVYEDNLSKAGESATIVRKLIARDNVIAVLGEVASSRSLEAADICQQYKIPQLSPSSTNPKVTEKGDYIFRVCFTDPFQGKLLANFVANDLKAKQVAILTDVASAYSVGLATYFKEPFVAGGGTIVAEQKYSGGDKDFKAQLTAVKALNPDAIFVPGYYGEAGLICQQARQLGIKIPIVGGDGWEAQDLIDIGKEAMEGTYFSTHYSSENQDPKIQDFVKRYKAKNDGQVPDAMAALGYDSVMVLADAIKRAGGTTEPQLRDAIAATKDYDGLTGKTTLDAERNATKSAVIITIEHGKFKYLKTINP